MDENGIPIKSQAIENRPEVLPNADIVPMPVSVSDPISAPPTTPTPITQVPPVTPTPTVPPVSPLPPISPVSQVTPSPNFFGSTQNISSTPTPTSNMAAKMSPSKPLTKNIYFAQNSELNIPKQKNVVPDQEKLGQEKQRSQDPSIKPVRTYEGDVANILAHKKTSTTTMAIAESKRYDGTERLVSNDTDASKSASKTSGVGAKILIVVLSLILIGGGIFGVYYLYSKSVFGPTTIAPASDTQTRTPIVTADTQTTISIDGLSRTDIYSRITKELAKPQTPNTIRELILTKTENTDTTNSQVIQVPVTEMIGLLQINVPDLIKRSLDQSWMLGIYADAYGGTSYFVILTNNYFQNTFAGMLQWESVMADDLKQYIYPESVKGIGNIIPVQQNIIRVSTSTSASTSPILHTSTTTLRISTSTLSNTSIKLSTSTTSKVSSTTATATSSIEDQTLSQYFTLRGHFIGKIVNNQDVREFQTESGQTLFMYAFLDNAKLVLAGNEQVISEIMSRLEKAAHIR